MKKLVITTEHAIRAHELAKDLKELNAEAIFNAIFDTGPIKDQGRAMLLRHVITIIPLNKTVTFQYPDDAPPSVITVSDFKINSSPPFRIRFTVKDHEVTGEYLIIYTPGSGKWSGYFLQKGDPFYILKGSIAESDV